MKKGQSYALIKHLALGLAASGGLMCAAAVSALPSANCAAMALLYLHAIQVFGTAGISGISVLAGIETPSRDDEKHHRKDFYFASGILLIGGIAIVLGVLLSITELPKAVGTCWHTAVL
jgi:hypothetical protein